MTKPLPRAELLREEDPAALFSAGQLGLGRRLSLGDFPPVMGKLWNCSHSTPGASLPFCQLSKWLGNGSLW